MISNWQCGCGARQSIKNRFCAQCGHEVPNHILDIIIEEETKAALASIGVSEKVVDYLESRATKKVCSNCKKTNTLNSNFCISCGSRLPVAPTFKSKSKNLAGILGVTLGWLGVHNFYLRNYKKARTQLGISVLSLIIHISFFEVVLFAVEIWAVMEGIFILAGEIKTDGDGIPLE